MNSWVVVGCLIPPLTHTTFVFPLLTDARKSFLWSLDFISVWVVSVPGGIPLETLSSARTQCWQPLICRWKGWQLNTLAFPQLIFICMLDFGWGHVGGGCTRKGSVFAFCMRIIVFELRHTNKHKTQILGIPKANVFCNHTNNYFLHLSFWVLSHIISTTIKSSVSRSNRI